MSAILKASITGITQTASFLNDMVKQEKWATAQALTDSGGAVQKWTVKKLLPSKFTLRAKNSSRPWYTHGKFKFKRTLANRQKLRSTVYSDAPWHRDHETGGTRRGIKNIGVPIAVKARPSKGSIIKAKDKPLKILKKKTARYTGKAIFLTSKKVTKLMYVTPKTVRIKRTLGFAKGARPIAEKAFRKAYPLRFNKQLKDSFRKHFGS